MDCPGETVTSTLLDTERIVVSVWETDVEEDWEGQLEGVFESRELLEIVAMELAVEASVAECDSTDEAEIIGVWDCNGDCVWEAIPVSLDDPIELGVIEFNVDPELLWTFELDGLAEYDTNPLGDPEILDEVVSKDVYDWNTEELGVIDHWLEYVVETVGVGVTRGDADSDIWEVDVLDTDVDPVILLDLRGVAELVDEIVWDLDTIDEPVAFTLGDPVLDTEVEEDTEFVEDMLPVELGDELLVDEAQLERDAEDVEDCVE